ncbi:hypothetical protein L593_00200 [Salinarchaeum sp. Harcht-Bsk1]|uniref:DUF447 domain-containing protein n=1 Tax=Salinarchaeum sp. Harcht-Bsk1 TaxID=1333523 RepID=UPI0003422D37|nr:DUF447 domain-containing protein [Salinarchaeum sp. Harcht-Bsk1]AGM99994.1 hypothetical protein L593_00200 [Salinarchaeum sp. Harcht-Bsk1]
MSHARSYGVTPDGERVEGWPARLAGVTETVIATKGPNDHWNQAALGISPTGGNDEEIPAGATTAATARSYGRTRTRRNLDAGRDAYVQFTTDPVDFVEAALTTFETDEPILERSAAWTRIECEERKRTVDRGTEIVTWTLEPVESGVRTRSVPTANRARAAVIEATVPASRLDVDGYDEADLLARLESLASVVDATGDARTLAAFDSIDEYVGWRDRIRE